MSDKRYNLKMTLTDGTEVDAGIITAPQGPAGEQGPQGEQGPSAYEVAVENGFEGTEEQWLESLKGGPQGPTGPTGPQGEQGESYLFCNDVYLKLSGTIKSGDTAQTQRIYFNREPLVGDMFIMLGVEGASIEKEYILFNKVTQVSETHVDFEVVELGPNIKGIQGPKGDPGLTAEQIQMFTYLAQHMTVDQSAGTVTFSLEIVAPSFNATTGDEA